MVDRFDSKSQQSSIYNRNAWFSKDQEHNRADNRYVVQRVGRFANHGAYRKKIEFTHFKLFAQQQENRDHFS